MISAPVQIPAETKAVEPSTALETTEAPATTNVEKTGKLTFPVEMWLCLSNLTFLCLQPSWY